MGTITVSHENKSLLAITTWVGSLAFHSLLILGAFAFLTQVTPPPTSKLLEWKVSLMNPAPSPGLSERAQTVKHVPAPTTRSTVSRPQPKRRLFQQRRIQQRQPSIHEAAVVTRPIAHPTQLQVPNRTNVQFLRASPQSTPNPVAQPKTIMVSTRQLMTTEQTLATLPAPTNTQHAIQKKITQTSAIPKALQSNSSLSETHSIKTVRKSEPTKTITTQRTKSRTSAPSAQTRHHHKSETIASGPPQQRPSPLMTRSHDSQQTTSVVKKRVVPAAKQVAIFTGRPNRQTTRKIPTHTQLTSISREAMKSPQKRHSDNNRVSNGLSKETLAFLKLLREKIERYRQYPRVAKRLGYQGTTTVSFTLSHDGNLTLLKVAEPSGHSILDEAALEAVQNITPLKPPTTIGGTPIEIPVAFELSR